MMSGDTLKGGWRSEAVKDALDLCLACKGCKHDCPVQVDMATYKAEFLSHYYRGRMRPLSAYLFGLIPWASRIASLIPGITNKTTRTRMFKRVTDIAPERALPGFAEHTFKHWFAHRTRTSHDGPRVVLWPDTFTNFFEPEVGIAAVQALEAVGCQVSLPRGSLCCGRPLYDYGMLDLARRQLRQILSRMRREIRAGVPVIGIEPSCTAVFRDELGNLFPDDADAQRLARQTFTLAEFLMQHSNARLPRLGGKALVHAHCHHKALFGTQALGKLLDQLGVDHAMPESGCCGMAGSFGYEAGAHHDVSIKAGERVLLPAVRAAPKDTLIIADGFSCRTQIASLTDRRALHPAQVIQIALQDARLAARDYPETDRYAERPTKLTTRDKAALGAGAAAAGALALWAIKRSRASKP
jgi:Fe-S oxidoreductase